LDLLSLLVDERVSFDGNRKVLVVKFYIPRYDNILKR
jgi:hypothetical protein